jgi:imidazolonepropionase-like amidohydrolase
LLPLRAQALFDGVAVTRGRVMVLVEGGRIVAVDRSGAVAPLHAEVVELADATLLPGVVDAHVHVAFEHTGPLRPAWRRPAGRQQEGQAGSRP